MADQTRDIAAEEVRRAKFADAPPPKGNTEWVDDDDFLAELRGLYLADITTSLPRILVERRTGKAADAYKKGPMRTSAYTNRTVGDPHIYLIENSDLYRKARKGDERARQALAAVIAHENSHLTFKGESATLADELNAYEQELARLRTMKADKGTIRKVEASRQAVVDQDAMIRRVQGKK